MHVHGGDGAILRPKQRILKRVSTSSTHVRKMKKCKGLVILDLVLCSGTSDFPDLRSSCLLLLGEKSGCKMSTGTWPETPLRRLREFCRTRADQPTRGNRSPAGMTGNNRPTIPSHQQTAMMQEKDVNPRKIWIDLDNTPHIPFFFPVIRELEARGYTIVLTARDCYQVCGLAKLFHLDCSVIGRHYGKNRYMKIAGALMRSCQLLQFARNHRPDIALSHGSRAQIIAASILGISTFVAIDYEHGQQLPFFSADLYMVPEVLVEQNPWPRDVVRSYPGIKEDVYVPTFEPDLSILAKLRIDPAAILMTVRPPATEAHYHNPDGEMLFAEVLNCFGAKDDIVMVILPRSNAQAEDIRQKWPDLLAAGKVIIPEQVVDGLNLMWHSDLVVSGGGTMNREAAALGVPVYSIFKGSIGAVDRYLEEKGRLILLDTPRDVREKIRLVKRQRDGQGISKNPVVLQAFVDEVVRVAESCKGK